MLLNIVTDDELLTSQIVKTILLIILAIGIIFNLYRVFKNELRVRKIINGFILAILLCISFLVFRQYRLEAALLKNPHFVPGTTLGDCRVFAEGRGVSFEYIVNGRKYIVCNTFHPLSRDSIKVPGAKYRVRYAPEFPGEGRMDFSKPIP